MKLNIGENIRSRRRKMNLTQEQLADKLGVSFQSVSRWENDMTYPDMELLPVLSEIFGVSVDELLGIPETKKKQAEFEVLKELTELSKQEDSPVERIIELIREIRRSFLNIRSIFHLRYTVNIDMYRRFPEILPEIRLTLEQAMESGEMNMGDKSTVIELMSIIEDDEHIEKFLDRYTCEMDITKNALLITRASYRGEWEKYDQVRQFELLVYIDGIIGSDRLWLNFGRPRDVDSNLMLCELQIDFLHRVCGQTPDKLHPVSADGELDFWVHERVWLGMKLSCRLAAAGRTEDAFTALEDTVSLLEKAMTITEPIELHCSSLYLADISFTAEEYWNNHNYNYFSEDKQERFIYIWNDHSCYCLNPANIRDVLKDEQSWAWFNPLRKEDRFKKYLDRVEKLIVYRNKPQETFVEP